MCFPSTFQRNLAGGRTDGSAVHAVLPVYIPGVGKVLCPINLLYYFQGMLRQTSVFLQIHLKMTPDMGQAGYEAHFFSTFKYIVGTVTVTLQISLEVLQQFPYSLSQTGAVIVMENDQLFHDRPDHLQILLVGLPLSLADYSYRGLVRLNISAADNQPDQLVIKWSQQFIYSVQCAFGKTDTQMAELLNLPVEWERDICISAGAFWPAWWNRPDICKQGKVEAEQ